MNATTSGVAKIIAKAILELIKEHYESSIDKERAGFPSGSSCIVHINILQIIYGQCAAFTSPFHLHLLDFVQIPTPSKGSVSMTFSILPGLEDVESFKGP